MAVEHQEDSQILLEQIMPQIAAQLRGAMGNIHTALTRLVPEEMPEGEGSTGQSAAILCQSYYRLLRLVNNLSAAPLISQTEPLETKNVELVAWLTELMHCAQPLVAHAGVRLTLRCSLTAHVAAIHPSYLERLLWNLLSNAVKYTPSGGEVTVTLRAAAGQVLLTVADSGVGIPRSSRRTSSTAIWKSCGCRLPHRVWGWACPCVRPLPVVTAGGCCCSPARRVPP